MTLIINTYGKLHTMHKVELAHNAQFDGHVCGTVPLYIHRLFINVYVGLQDVQFVEERVQVWQDGWHGWHWRGEVELG